MLYSWNLITTNAILMKLTTIMYLHEAFNLAKNGGVTYRTQEGAIKKPLIKRHKMSFWVNFLKFSRPYQKCQLFWCVTMVALSSWSKFFKESDHIWESYGQKMIQKQPEMVVFAAMKTFESSKLGNRKCYTNETYHDYIYSCYFSFDKTLGRHP